MRPALRLLDDRLIDRILDEARTLLAELGVDIHNPDVLGLLGDHGARVDRAAGRAWIPGSLVDRALATVSHTVALYDALGAQTHHLGGDRVYFTPGSAAIHILDGETGEIRPPATDDYVRYVKVVSGLEHIAAQSTAFIPADVPSRISDSYRRYL
jgi:trimethylamine--corrinoid protein Co-methyltransferase